MSTITIHPPTSVLISIEVRRYDTNALIDPTTLAATITDYEGTVLGTKVIGDMANASTGLYSFTFLFPASAAEGLATVNISADAAVTASAITKPAYVIIK